MPQVWHAAQLAEGRGNARLTEGQLERFQHRERLTDEPAFELMIIGRRN
jgi:hypothetical protein